MTSEKEARASLGQALPSSCPVPGAGPGPGVRGSPTAACGRGHGRDAEVAAWADACGSSAGERAGGAFPTQGRAGSVRQRRPEGPAHGGRGCSQTSRRTRPCPSCGRAGCLLLGPAAALVLGWNLRDDVVRAWGRVPRAEGLPRVAAASRPDTGVVGGDGKAGRLQPDS